jgi:ribonuclease HI
MKHIIFTDGSSRGNPGPGGWGAVIISEGNVKELGGKDLNTTNNRMELTAAIEALGSIEEGDMSTIYTDSSYVKNGITKWIHAWKKSDWKTSGDEDVLNKDLWQALDRVSQKKNIDWQYVGGHSGIPGNERCDQIATSFADSNPTKLYSGNIDGYEIKDILSISTNGIKKPSKKGSKSKAYSYVSMVDGVIETHKTWPECESRVKGKSGARFMKSSSPENEAEIIRSFGTF